MNPGTPNQIDPDDWFAEPEPSPPRRTHSPAGVASEAPNELEAASAGAGSPQALAGGRSNVRRFVAAALVVIVLVVIGLAAAGAFSSGSPSHATIASVRTVTTEISTTAPTTPAVKAPTVTLKPGDSGTQVRLLQRALASLGYSPGKIDGDYGSATVQAVTSFQRANNLTSDGVVGPATLAALKRALQNSG